MMLKQKDKNPLKTLTSYSYGNLQQRYSHGQGDPVALAALQGYRAAKSGHRLFRQRTARIKFKLLASK